MEQLKAESRALSESNVVMKQRFAQSLGLLRQYQTRLLTAPANGIAPPQQLLQPPPPLHATAPAVMAPDGSAAAGVVSTAAAAPSAIAFPPGMAIAPELALYVSTPSLLSCAALRCGVSSALSVPPPAPVH
jgi:hypothetical protein